ncbi:hypothetical protein Tco_1272775 [Tanacetum coccineum]
MRRQTRGQSDGDAVPGCGYCGAVIRMSVESFNTEIVFKEVSTYNMLDCIEHAGMEGLHVTFQTEIATFCNHTTVIVVHYNIKSVEMESSTQQGPVNGIGLGEQLAHEKFIVRVGSVKSELPVQHPSSSKSHGQPNLSLPKGKRKLD